MSDKEWNPADVFDLFGDDLARRILVLASERPLSADELAETLDTSLPTVYRRVNALDDHDLLTERQEIDADGNHYKTFETALDSVTFEIEDGGYNVDIRVRQSLVDDFGDLWSDLREGSPEESIDPAEGAEANRPQGDAHHG